MAISTPVNLGTTASKAVSTIAITTVATVNAGELIVVAVGTNDGNLTNIQLTISDSASNNYTFVDRESPNADSLLGSLFIYQCTNANTLTSGSSITATTSVGSILMAINALSVDGIIDQTPLSISTFGNNATPSTTQSGLTNGKNYLALGYVYTEGPAGDTFTQASTWNAPPTRVGTTGAGAATNNTIAGGYNISNTVTSFTYAPSITSRPWGSLLIVYEEIITTGGMFFVF